MFTDTFKEVSNHPSSSTLAQFSWLWEYKRKLRKIPKKEREKGGIS